MNKDWQEYLLNAGGTLSEEGSFIFPGDKQLAAKDTVCSLTGDVVLRVAGDDAESFLQGQFSNDLAALGLPASHLNTWSSPKGRVVALFRVVRDADGYLIKMPQELAEQTLKRLKMYVLRAKVTIELQPDLVCLGLSGENGSAVLKKIVQTLPQVVDETAVADDMTVYRVRGQTASFEVIATVDAASKLWEEAASSGCREAGESVWRLFAIDAGVPRIGAATAEAFVLQMLNLQHINGVSFKKGCFPGQEVVARMQYLGKLKRRMYRASGTLADPSLLPAPGDEVYNKGVASPVGKIVDAQIVGDGSYRMLLVNAIAAAELPLFLDSEATLSIQLLELPYSLDSEKPAES